MMRLTGRASEETVLLFANARIEGTDFAREFQLIRGQPQRLGRMPRVSPETDFGAELVFPNDNKISNNHATLTWEGTRLLVQRRASAKNPILVVDPKEPNQLRPEDEFRIGFGERFAIGDTFFTLKKYLAPIEMTLGAKELASLVFQDPLPKIEALAKLLEMIRLSPTESELTEEVLQVLLEGVPRAECVALVRINPDDSVKVISAHGRKGRLGHFEPSRQLVAKALRRFDNVWHLWADIDTGESDTPTRGDMDWAICVQIEDPQNQEGLYLAGRSPIGLKRTGSEIHASQLDGDMKFAHLAGNVFSSLRKLRGLQEREAFLAKLLTPVVRHAAHSGQNIEEFMTPKECPVTVLFCDLRGSVPGVAASKSSLMQTWAIFADLLDVMTDEICTMDGVIGDFQGDAAMGFWGWPQPQADQIERAARAALNIRKKFVEFASRHDHPLSGFACGIGIAHGPAVTGRLGTRDQAKIGVFGPVVNRAARLEGVTKALRVPILIDDAVLKHLSSLQNREWGRVRRLAKVQPEGFAEPVLIGELLPPVGEPGPNLIEENRQRYEVALDHFLGGDWSRCQKLIRVFPNDGPVDFLKRFIASQATGSPPPDWNGGIPVLK